MTATKWLIDTVFRDAEDQGSWSAYAIFCMGEVNSGDKELDKAIEMLYNANEEVYRLANKLALRHNLDPFNGN